MQSIQNAVSTQFWAVRDYLAPVLRDSKFKEHGRITPDEFVAAGDFLTYKFGTWTWEAGDKSKSRDFLPADKQYLVQRNVPCIRRVKQMQKYSGADGEDEDKETLMTFKAEELLGEPDSPDDEWVATHTGGGKANKAKEEPVDIPDIAEPRTSTDDSTLSRGVASLNLAQDKQEGSSAVPDMEDIPDIEDDDDLAGAGVEEPEDEAAAPSASTVPAPVDSSGNVLSVRTYDCYITYDKLWQVPRMWLSGLSPSRQPLTTPELFEDITADYAQKTVTIEPFPHKEGISMASVHPCKHANVMKKVIERMDAAAKAEQKKLKALEQGGGIGNADSVEVVKDKEKKKKGWGLPSAVKRAAGIPSSSAASAQSPAGAGEEEVEGLRVDQYLLIFLKFLSNVVPTIELDATTAL